MGEGQSEASELRGERNPPTDDFQRRIMAMLEGAALGLMADYLHEREARVRETVIQKMHSEVQRLQSLRQQVHHDQQALEAAKREHAQVLQQANETRVRARKRVRRAAKIVERYRKTFEEIREQINGVLGAVDEVFSESVVSDLEAIVRLIEEVAELDPEDSE